VSTLSRCRPGVTAGHRLATAFATIHTCIRTAARRVSIAAPIQVFCFSYFWGWQEGRDVFVTFSQGVRGLAFDIPGADTGGCDKGDKTPPALRETEKSVIFIQCILRSKIHAIT